MNYLLPRLNQQSWTDGVLKGLKNGVINTSNFNEISYSSFVGEKHIIIFFNLGLFSPQMQ